MLPATLDKHDINTRIDVRWSQTLKISYVFLSAGFVVAVCLLVHHYRTRPTLSIASGPWPVGDEQPVASASRRVFDNVAALFANSNSDFVIAYTRNIPVNEYLLRFSPTYQLTYKRIAEEATGISDPGLHAQKCLELWRNVDRNAIIIEAAEAYQAFQAKEFASSRQKLFELGRLGLYSPSNHSVDIAPSDDDGAALAVVTKIVSLPIEEYDSVEQNFKTSASLDIDDCVTQFRHEISSYDYGNHPPYDMDRICIGELMGKNLRAFFQGDIRAKQVGTVYVVNFSNGDLLDKFAAERLSDAPILRSPPEPYQLSDWNIDEISQFAGEY